MARPQSKVDRIEAAPPCTHDEARLWRSTRDWQQHRPGACNTVLYSHLPLPRCILVRYTTMLSPPSASLLRPARASSRSTPTLLAAQGGLWRAHSLGQATAAVVPSSFVALDAELPGGAGPAGRDRAAGAANRVLEWRLLAPALRAWWRPRPYPTKPPVRVGVWHGPSRRGARRRSSTRPTHRICRACRAWGWIQAGRHRRWFMATATPAQALWTAEQAIKSRVAVLAWLPEARPEQLRRLQVHAQSSDAPAFWCGLEHAGQQPRSRQLRLAVRPGEDSGGWRWTCTCSNGAAPAHEGWLKLQVAPGAVEPLLTSAAGACMPRQRSAPRRPPCPPRPCTAPHPRSAPMRWLALCCRPEAPPGDTDAPAWLAPGFTPRVARLEESVVAEVSASLWLLWRRAGFAPEAAGRGRASGFPAPGARPLSTHGAGRTGAGALPRLRPCEAA